MKKFNQREIVLLICTILVIIVFFCLRLIQGPLGEYAQSIKERINIMKDKINKADQTILEVGLYEKSFNKFIKSSSNQHLKDISSKELINKLETLFNSFHVNLIKKDFQQELKETEASVFVLDIEFEGKWEDIHQLIYSLQTDPYFFLINTLDLKQTVQNPELLNGKISVVKQSFALNIAH